VKSLSRSAAALALAMGFTLACASSHPHTSATADVKSDEFEITEAVFRHQLDHDEPARMPRTFDFVLLSLSELHNPPPDLVARFSDQAPPVDSVSELRIDGQRGIHHKTRPGRGIILIMKSLRRLAPNRFEVEGELRRDGCSTGHRYLVERRGDSWIVASDDLEWIT
jgi:hypothetical protein